MLIYRGWKFSNCICGNGRLEFEIVVKIVRLIDYWSMLRVQMNLNGCRWFRSNHENDRRGCLKLKIIAEIIVGGIHARLLDKLRVVCKVTFAGQHDITQHSSTVSIFSFWIFSVPCMFRDVSTVVFHSISFDRHFHHVHLDWFGNGTVLLEIQ
jgi:hypothetical protein